MCFATQGKGPRHLGVLVGVVEEVANNYDFLRDLSESIDVCEEV